MLKFLISFLLGTAIIFSFFFSIYRVEGRSMSPLIEDGSILLVRNQVFKTISPKKGDILVFKSPETGRLNVKRCTAVDEDGIFLIGLNLPHSTDSRHFGRVPSGEIRGKVLFY